MNFEELVGKQADAECVVECLVRFGLPSKVNVPHDEVDIYLNRENQGISFLFRDERYLAEQNGVDFPSDAPVLAAIFLYGQGDDEFSEYRGALPGGLSLSDGQEQARAKLGPSVKFNDARGLEIWELRERIRLFVLYGDDLKSIARLQFGVLWK